MADATSPTPIVEMRGIEKAFGAVQALRNVDLVLYPGEILGLVGDNSAGKSTRPNQPSIRWATACTIWRSSSSA